MDIGSAELCTLNHTKFNSENMGNRVGLVKQVKYMTVIYMEWGMNNKLNRAGLR